MSSSCERGAAAKRLPLLLQAMKQHGNGIACRFAPKDMQVIASADDADIAAALRCRQEEAAELKTFMNERAKLEERAVSDARAIHGDEGVGERAARYFTPL